MIPDLEYERGLHVGRVYAEEDRGERDFGFEAELRGQARRAIDDALRGTHRQRCWAAYELGVARGYRAATRPAQVSVLVISDQGVQPGVLTADERGDVIRLAPDDGPYDITDPKHPRHHEVMADYADLD